MSRSKSITDNIGWLEEIEKAKIGKAVNCPKCSSANAEVKLYSFKDFIGYITGKCKDCGNEVYISRVMYKATDKVIKLDDMDDKNILEDV